MGFREQTCTEAESSVRNSASESNRPGLPGLASTTLLPMRRISASELSFLGVVSQHIIELSQFILAKR